VCTVEPRRETDSSQASEKVAVSQVLTPGRPGTPYLILLEVDIAQVQDGGQDAKDAILVFTAEAQHLHGGQETAEVVCVTLACDLTVPPLGKSRDWGQGMSWRAQSPPGVVLP
jgi:hypothetical protein